MAEFEYFVCRDRGLDPLPWDPYDPVDLPLPDCAYLGQLFRSFEECWEGEPLTVYLTKAVSWLPRYGDDVVAVLLNEEWFRTPAYSGEILAVLRNLVGAPWFPWSTLAPPSPVALAALANHLRILLVRERWTRLDRARARSLGWREARTDNTFDIPLGYFRQPELPTKPYDERETDIYFGGSLIHDLARGERWKRVLKQAFGSPKQLFRKDMIENLEAFAASRPDLRVKLTVSGDFRELSGGDVTSYASDMLSARVALVPRGTAYESYRLFEAWRYGCIPVCEEQPPRWFYDGAPYIGLRSWRDAGHVLTELFDDPERQLALHHAGQEWWRAVCSGQAVGRRAARHVTRLRGTKERAPARALA